MTFSKNVPHIRIGVIQSVDQVNFQCSKSFSVKNSEGNILYSGSANQNYTLTIASSLPAEIRYQLRAGIEKKETDAKKLAEKLERIGLKPQIRTVGMMFTINDRKVDNREFWITVGEFSTHNEALEFRNQQAEPGEFVVIEKILKPATGAIELAGQKLGDVVRIVPTEQDDTTHITVSNVMIGIQFHWQRYEDLDYRGLIEVGFNNHGKLVVINELDLENYLVSVNSSEMTPDCPIGLLEAQTVVARNTVLATMGKHHYNTNFHLCSDDHCQCYQGKKREQSISRQAVENTWGEVLLHEAEICDTRYSKICGGIMEAYQNVWENRNIPYMVSGIDSDQPIDYPANTEEKAKNLIDSDIPAYCNTGRYPLPPRLANLYSTQNLFRWEVIYHRQELEQLISEKTGQDIGELEDIIPLTRGDSGRLIYIELVGSKKKIKIGKELEIRRVLSKSHLYSSCFYIEKKLDDRGKVEQIILKGGGWGHGVGLCQVGATVMAMKNIPYQKILNHYYKNTQLVQFYSFK